MDLCMASANTNGKFAKKINKLFNEHIKIYKNSEYFWISVLF